MKSKFPKLLVAAIAAVTAMAMVAPMAQAVVPAPPYSQFAGCPSLKENPSVSVCVRSVVNSGNFKMGNKDVPITKPIILTGGANEYLENFVANSEGGLKPAKQKVPGGVIGLTGLTWLAEFLGSEALTLYAVTELVGAPALSPNISLPIRVHLENSALGKNCYVGSVSSPIKLNLTATKEPFGSFEEATEIVRLTGGVYQDKTFSAPGASGCVLTLFGFIPISINGLVNTASGLPAATGNETNQQMDIEFTDVRRVYP
jgi:hypothetical protein